MLNLLATGLYIVLLNCHFFKLFIVLILWLLYICYHYLPFLNTSINLGRIK